MNWYAIHTKPRSELLAQRSLDREHIQTFYPKLKRRKTIRRVRRWVTGPLFPSYIFARFDLAQHGRLVQYANGIANLVSFGGKPAIVEDQLITAILDHCATAVATPSTTPQPHHSISPIPHPPIPPSLIAPRHVDTQALRHSPLPDTVILVSTPFKPGERVTIASGPLMGFHGLFEKEMSDRDRVVILLDTIGRASRVQVSREQIEKIGD